MPTQSDMIQSGSSGLAVGVRQSYDKTMLAYNQPELVHAQFAEDRPIPQGEGATINFRRMDRFAVATTPLVEGITPNPSTVTEVGVSLTPRQYGDWKYGTDVVQVTQIDDVLGAIVQRQGQQSGETFDTIARDAENAGTNVLFPGTHTLRSQVAAGELLTGALIRRALAILKKGYAKPRAGGNYVAIITVDTESDLFVDSEWKTPHQYCDPAGIYKGEIGMLYGVRFVTSPLAKTFAGAGASGINVQSTLVFGADAFLKSKINGLALETFFHPKGSAGTNDPLNQRWSQGWKGTFVAGIQNDVNVVRIEHAATNG